MWVFKAIIVLYLSAAFAAQDSGEALPVPRVHLQSHWSEVFPPEQVRLRCDVNGEDWTVIWYRDEQEIQTTDTSVILSEDARSLTLKAEAQTQSGSYRCKGFRKSNASLSTQDSDALQITVHGQKLKPALSVSGSEQDVLVGQSVTFRCGIDVLASWEYIWYLNDNIEHQSTVDVYTIQSAEEAHNGKYHCKVKRGGVFVSTDSNTVSVKVSDVPRPRAKLVSSWSDVIEKEQVLLRCETDGPDWRFTWFRGGEQLTESPNIKFSDDGGAQLIMSSVPKILQGLYTCRAEHNAKQNVRSGQSEPIRITIHDMPTPTLSKDPSLSRMYVGETVNFTCAVHVSSGWTYKWYRSNAEISHTGSTLSIRLGLGDTGKYWCKALRANGTETHSSEKKTQTVDGVPVPTVKLVSPWADVFVNEVVILSCVVSSTGWSFSWLKNGQILPADGYLSMSGEKLYISALRSHTGAYSCIANHKDRPVHSEPSQPLDVKVYENTPKPTLSQIDPKYNPMYVGETVRFACIVDVSSGWKFKWFKDESEITLSDSSSVQLDLSHGGKYSCKGTRGGQITTDHSDKISLTVLEIPTPQLKAVTPWLDVFPYETVELGCGASSTPSDWTYMWYKDEQAMSRSSNSVSSDSDGATLTIGSAASSHRGQYKCKATLKSRRVITPLSAGLTVNVYDQKPRPILMQDPDYSILFPQEPLSLQCHINISNGWEFVWYKNNEQLKINQNKYEVTPDTAHSGSYTCEARRGKDHIFTSDLSQAKNVEIRKDVPEPVLAQVPAVDKVYMGEQLMLKCNLDVSIDWEYHWYKDEQIIFSNVSDITINATHPHSEVYKCEAKRRKTRFETKSQPKVIAISAIPTPSAKGVTPWLDVFPGETVLFSCGMKTEASDWIYKWSKDGQPIEYEESVKSDQGGTSLTIISSVSHAGEYSCMAKHRERAVFSNYSSGIRLEVYDTKPRVTLVQDPEVKVFHTQDSVFFSCGVNVSSGWQYSWYRNNQMLASGPNFTIGQLSTSHSGEYKCRAKRGQEVTVFHTDHSWSVTLNVNERPSASILLLTGWSEVFSTDSLTLKCEAKDTYDGDWRFKWFKGGEEIAQNMSKHLVTPQNDPEQSEYTCQGVRTGRPSYTTFSEPLKTKNLLLKRRVLLSISGCLVFGICAVFLGCILLRVFRKPVVDQEKPEEADLFLTMAQLEKNAPNPLAEYITDGDIEDMAKEPADTDENGTICSESTLLPVISKEDEATPSQSKSAFGNGEMVSFKQ